MANQPEILNPAYQRGTDKSSIDTRMAEQLEFENGLKRSTPREFNLENLGNKSEKTETKQNRLRKAGRTILVTAGVLAAGYGFTKIAPDDPKPIRPNVPVSYDYVGHGVQPILVNQDLKSEQK